MFSEYHTLRDAVATAEHCMESAEYFSLYAQFLDILRRKFDWVDELPYFVWQVKDAASAARFIDLHAQQLSAEDPVHRVTHYFVGASPGTLREDMVEYATCGQCSARLATELRTFQLCVLDEIIHRRATFATISHIGASLRMQQHLSEIAKHGPAFQKRVEHWWHRVPLLPQVADIAKGHPRHQHLATKAAGVCLSMR